MAWLWFLQRFWIFQNAKAVISEADFMQPHPKSIRHRADGHLRTLPLLLFVRNRLMDYPKAALSAMASKISNSNSSSVCSLEVGASESKTTVAQPSLLARAWRMQRGYVNSHAAGAWCCEVCKERECDMVCSLVVKGFIVVFATSR